MAIATAYYGVNMDTATTWYGDVTIANDSQVQIVNAGYVQNYYGSGFTYDYYTVTGGTVTSTNYYEYGTKVYQISGGSYSAATVASYVNSGNMNGLFAYIFGGADVFNGSSQADAVNAYGGDDKIYGNGGDDLLKGGAGNDLLSGGTGWDTLLGGSGNDTYYVDNANDKVFETTTSASTTNAGGTDNVNSSVTFDLSANIGVSFVENLTLTGAGIINATGNALANTLVGNSAANILNGKAGADIMLGGSGNDTYYVDNAGDKVYETTTTTSTTNATGTDTVISAVTFSLNATFSVSFVENLRLNSGNAINGTGNALNNTIYAGAGNNTIDGLGGTDTVSYGYATAGVSVTLGNTTTAQLTGGSGSDLIRNVENLTGSNYADTLTGNTLANTLMGSDGADTLFGLNGNDILRGGREADVLWGGGGQDVFRFDTGQETVRVPNVDQIKDFVVADDTIQLENAIFTKFAATGTLNSGWFQTVGAINVDGVASDDYILYNKSTGALSYDADGSGSGAAVQFATIGINLSLTNADFVIV